jgi:hypothetical protein
MPRGVARASQRLQNRGGQAKNPRMAKLKGTAVACGLSGSAGPVVFVRMPGGGTAVRDRTVPRDPNSPAQAQWRGLVARASALWRTLTPEQAQRWQEYAEAAGEGREGGRPNASGLFVGLAAKVWQVEAAAAPPLDPPSQGFLGDGVPVSAAGEPGAVRFAAGGPNSAGVVTELLLQRLPSRLARPQKGRDRHRGFVAFAPGSLEASVPAPPGAYAASVRFVLAATGQASALVRLGTVVAG